MSAPHPLNQAVIAQALHDLRNGQLRRCKSHGLRRGGAGCAEAPRTREHAGECHGVVVFGVGEPGSAEAAAEPGDDVEREIATVDRMLRLGASTEMVSKFYGLTHQEVALRRDILGLPKRRAGIRCSTRRRTWPCGALEGQRRRAPYRPDRRHGDAGADHGSGRGAEPADVGDLVGDTQLDRPGAGVGHDHGRRTTARRSQLRCRRSSTRRCGT